MVELCDLFPEDTGCQDPVEPEEPEVPIEEEPVEESEPEPVSEETEEEPETEEVDPEPEPEIEEPTAEETVEELIPPEPVCTLTWCQIDPLSRYRMWRFLNKEVRQQWFFANVTYLLVAGGIVARSGLHLFRYR